MLPRSPIQKILLAPLDWGLGHATRCIPLIRALTDAGYEVVLAAENAQAALLKQEFPLLVCLPLEGYRVRYSRSRWWLPLRLLAQLPRLLRVIRGEHRWLQRIVREQSIDLVISDNRFGLYSREVPCVFITHQLTIKAPVAWLESALRRINYRFINRFSACWVPDSPGEDELAGVLSHPPVMPKVPVTYIGLLSRFTPSGATPVYDYCFLLSGPEPQRTILEKKVLEGIKDICENILLVRGLPGNTETLPACPRVTVYNHLPGSGLRDAMEQSRLIICRGGYTTLMELVTLRRQAILIPTPGQTEQEYLAQELYRRKAFYTVKQEQFDCAKHLPAARGFDYHPVNARLFDASSVADLIQAVR